MLDPMDLLDPELRPIPPQPGCEPSMQIYQDHRRVRKLKIPIVKNALKLICVPTNVNVYLNVFKFI